MEVDVLELMKKLWLQLLKVQVDITVVEEGSRRNRVDENVGAAVIEGDVVVMLLTEDKGLKYCKTGQLIFVMFGSVWVVVDTADG
ncbi:hypothetical protein TNCV_772021 [Trichonephila clavipes]|nr:hypothetical protein TNCV_772021 [Trichonephila clavipes]